MPSNRGQSKKLARQKARRSEVRKNQARAEAARAPHALVRRAQDFPIDKTYLSEGWRDTDDTLPSLVSAVMVRRRGTTTLVGWALIDRTCLGVKNGFVRVVSDDELAKLLSSAAQMHGDIEEVDLLTWHSVVFHAIDFARTVGFEPHPDLPMSFLGPRPEVLLDTPLGNPQRPTYVAGPDDNPKVVLTNLVKARGADFRAVLGQDSDHPVVLDPSHGQILEPLFDDEQDSDAADPQAP